MVESSSLSDIHFILYALMSLLYKQNYFYALYKYNKFWKYLSPFHSGAVGKGADTMDSGLKYLDQM